MCSVESRFFRIFEFTAGLLDFPKCYITFFLGVLHQNGYCNRNQVGIWSCGVIVAIENDEIVVCFDGYNSRHDRRIKMSEEGFTEIRQKTELSSPLSQETKRRRVKDYEVILLYFLWWFQYDKNGFPHNNMHMVTHRVFQ